MTGRRLTAPMICSRRKVARSRTRRADFVPPLLPCGPHRSARPGRANPPRRPGPGVLVRRARHARQSLLATFAGHAWRLKSWSRSIRRGKRQPKLRRVCSCWSRRAGCGGSHRGVPCCLRCTGNGDNGRRALNGWHPIVAEGWLLAALQSSQAGWSDAISGTTRRRPCARLPSSMPPYARSSRYQPGVAGRVLDGRRDGVRRAALGGTVPARGFLLLGPGGPTIDTPDAWLPLIGAGRGTGAAGLCLHGRGRRRHPPGRHSDF